MAGFVTVQGKITTTGTTQQLASNPGQYRGVTLVAKSTNTAAIGVTVSAAAGSGAVDGTGTGYILEKGTSVNILGLNDTNAIFLTGTSGDIFSLLAS